MLSKAKLRWRSLADSGVSFDGLLVVTVVLLLAAGMVSIFVDLYDLWKVVLGWLVVEVLVAAAIFRSEWRSAQRLAEVAMEIREQNEELEPDRETEPAPIISSDPIGPR